MKTLVTGSSGLIGRWLCGRLQQEGLQVVGLDIRPPAKSEWANSHHQADILDIEALHRVFQEERPAAIIHLAARCDLEGESLDDYEVNRQGVRNVCAAVRECESVHRAIYTSSQLVCAIGHVPKNDTDYCPNTPYGESKVCTEMIVREEDGGGAQWTLVRPTTVWGPHVNPHYQSLLHHIRRGTYFHSGSGQLLKSYGFAGNVAYQYLKLLTAPQDAVHQRMFLLADYEPFSLRTYCDRLAEEFDARTIPTVPLPIARMIAWTGDVLNLVGLKRFPYNSFRLNNIRTEYVYDMSTTQAVCGNLPYDFETGVRLTAKWFLDEIVANSHII